MKFASQCVIALAAIASVAGFASTASADPYVGHEGWARYHHRQHVVMIREHHRADGFRHGGREHAFARNDHMIRVHEARDDRGEHRDR